MAQNMMRQTQAMQPNFQQINMNNYLQQQNKNNQQLNNARK